MEEAFRRAEARFGAVHGVIHGAGIVGGSTFRPLGEIGRAECEQQFHPKVEGLLVLDRVLAGRELDFCLLTSSLSSVLAAAYSATPRPTSSWTPTPRAEPRPGPLAEA
jgi:NAD(P)-dependent dehydrogenase (short-subunit alcohol dehydrogenase family)